METVNIHMAKTHLSRLVERVLQGEEIIITRSGKPVARIVPLKKQSEPRRPGGNWRGKIKTSRDLDELPEDLMDAFYGEEG